MGYMAKTRKNKVRFPSQEFHCCNTAHKTQPQHSTEGTAEPQVWKTFSKQTESKKIFIVKMGSDQEEPEQQHLNMQDMAEKMKGGEKNPYLTHNMR